MEKTGEETKRKLAIEAGLPDSLIYEESKKMCRFKTQPQYEINEPELEIPDENEPNDNGGIYYEDFAPKTFSKNTNIYSSNKERVTTRASTGYRSSPL